MQPNNDKFIFHESWFGENIFLFTFQIALDFSLK